MADLLSFASSTHYYGTHKPPPADVLAEIGRHFLRMLLTEESRRLYRLVLANVERHPEVAKAFYRTGPSTFMERLAGYLKAKSDDGSLQVDDPRLAAAQFFANPGGAPHAGGPRRGNHAD